MRGEGALRLSGHEAYEPARRDWRGTLAVRFGVEMRFFIGALALTVICVLVGLPVAAVLGWVPLTATERKVASSGDKSDTPALPN